MPRGKKRVREAVESAAEGETGAVMAITLSQTLPVDSPAIRIRDQFSSEKSAVAQPTKKVSLNWSGTGTSPTIPITQALVGISRDPLHAILFSDNNQGSSGPTIYDWAGFNTASGIQGFSVQKGVTVALRPFGAAFVSGKAFHGPFLWAYYDNTADNVYIQADAPSGNANSAVSKLDITTNDPAVAASDTFEIGVYRYNNGIDSLVASATVTGTAGAQTLLTVTIPGTDLYRVQLQYSSAVNATTSISVRQTWNCGTICNQPLPGLDLAKASQVQAIRILGASVKISNQTPDQYKGGSVTAVQMHQGDTYLRVVNAQSGSSTPYDFLNGLRGSFEQPFNNGFYGFLKYGEEEDTGFLNPFKFDSSSVIVEATSNFPPTAGFIMVGISAPDANQITPRGQVTMTFNFNIEYFTQDPWTATDIPRTLPEDHERANILISSMQQFYENPIHWQKIWKTVGRYSSVASRVLAAIPNPYAQAGAQIANTIGNVAQQLQ